MRKFSFYILLMFVSLSCFAQKRLVFTNVQKQKVVELRVGNRATFYYKGYMDQPECVKETISDITDSTVVLGLSYDGLLPKSITKPGKYPKLMHKIIRIEDITGFRKMGTGRMLAKSAVSIGGIFASYYLLKNIYSSNMSSGTSILLSMGVGFGLLGVTELLFPENIKHYTEDGWQAKVVD
ncbi:hypothetical protein AEM51_00260 [Bacteroidetes bacterium UKL13-3]|jgi:hypothetical protein|nr:hypothetical protein AEM51_00260 [Bacteroidetes bacterium UKL13-3]HCP94650.1 hypothetical protein [Bacteroidota bacterium]